VGPGAGDLREFQREESQPMKRLLASALILGLFSTVGLVGCGEKAETKSEVTTSTPGGKTTETSTTEVKQTGNNPPPPASGAPAPSEAPK